MMNKNRGGVMMRDFQAEEEEKRQQQLKEQLQKQASLINRPHPTIEQLVKCALLGKIAAFFGYRSSKLLLLPCSGKREILNELANVQTQRTIRFLDEIALFDSLTALFNGWFSIIC